MSATGFYCADTDVQNLFGLQNVIAWSNLDGTSASQNDTRVKTALTYADGQINGFFQDGPFTVPLSMRSDSSIVINWAATIAGVWLHNNRGQGTEGEAPNQYQGNLGAVKREMALYKSGALRLNAARRWPTATAPFGY